MNPRELLAAASRSIKSLLKSIYESVLRSGIIVDSRRPDLDPANSGRAAHRSWVTVETSDPDYNEDDDYYMYQEEDDYQDHH